MKKSVYLLLFLLPALINAQPCLPGGIIFYTQSEIDNFQTDFPNCTDITGDVEIRGADITNLNGLNVIATIGGYLKIHDNFSLTTLKGLDSLTSVGGYLWIADHPSLTSLEGLENLNTVLAFVYVGNNTVLTDLEGLNNLTYAGVLDISFNPVLTGLSGLEELSKIESYLSVSDNAELQDFTGLKNLDSIGGMLYIANNNKLKNFTGLNNVIFIGGDIDIPLNSALTSFSGLDNLTSVGGHIWISDNASLSSLSGLDNVQTIGGYLMIKYNTELTSINGIHNIEAASIDSLLIIDNYALSTCEVKSICDFLASPGGKITITNNASGCNTKEEVEEACAADFINERSTIQDLSSFPNPFTTSTTIEYHLTSPQTVTINFYNQFGKLVDVIEDWQQAGLNKVVWVPGNLADGIYYFRLETSESMVSGKVVLVR